MGLYVSSPRFTKTNMCIETRAQAEKKELRIDDKIYDVTNFAKKHPGGKVVLFQVGTDASDAFHAFHDKSKSAKKWLKTLESRDAKPSDIPNLADSDPLTRDFRVLREQLRTEGFFDPSVRQITWRMTELFLMHIIGVYLVLQGYRWPGIAVLGVASGRCGWFMHEGGHYSLTGNIKFDRHIQMFFYGVGCGMSGCYWRNQHNKHHATPQKIKHDVDLEALPLVAFHKVVAQKAKGSLQKLWISWQAYLFCSCNHPSGDSRMAAFHPSKTFLPCQELHRIVVDGCTICSVVWWLQHSCRMVLWRGFGQLPCLLPTRRSIHLH